MLPSSSSQLARYGNISHYKKFWLLQSTQLEKQEQSSSSSTLSLGSSSTAAATPSSHAIKESSKLSSLITHHVNGDVQHHAIIAPPQYGICRMDMAGSSSRVNSTGCSAPAFGPNEPANCVSPYFTSMQGYGLQVSNVMSMRGESGGPRLSLAVTCDNMDVIKPANYEWQSSSSSSQPQCNEQKQQVIASLADAEEGGSNGCEEEKIVCNGTFEQTLAMASAPQLMRIGGQTQLASGFQCTNIPTHDTTSASGLPSSSSNLRTCTLCGTTRTPLWRSGPDGPKSLCNACGIRVKKTKRLEAALQATGGSAPSPSTMSAFKGALKRKLSSDGQKDPTFHKKKRSTSIFMSSHSRKPGGLWDNSIPKVASYSESGRSSANIFAEDVEEGAVLLMALSCGLVLS